MECQLPEAKNAKIYVDNNSEDKEYETKKEETGRDRLLKAGDRADLAWKVVVVASEAFPNDQRMKEMVEICDISNFFTWWSIGSLSDNDFLEKVKAEAVEAEAEEKARRNFGAAEQAERGG